MIRGSRALAVVGIALAACATPPRDTTPPVAAVAPAPAPRAVAPPADARPCAERAAELGAWMTEIASQGAVIFRSPPLVPTTRVPTPLTELKLVFIATPEGIRRIPDPVGQALAYSLTALPVLVPADDLTSAPRVLSAELKSWSEYRQMIDPKSVSLLASPRAVFFVARDTPWRVVVPVLAALQDSRDSRVTRVDLVLGAANTVASPPAGVPDYPGPEDWWFAHDDLFRSCSEAHDAVAGLVAMTQRNEQIGSVAFYAPNAIAACGCRVDMDAVRRWFWAYAGRNVGEPWTSFEVKFGPDGAPFQAPADARWDEVVMRLEAAAAEDRLRF